MEFKSIKELEIYLQKQIDEALQNEVAEVAKEEIVESANKNVYGAYKPVQYIRRISNQGLSDKENMSSVLVKSGELIVSDDAPFNPDGERLDGHNGIVEHGKIDMSKSLAYNIEYGWGNKETPYSEARPFIEDARNNLENGIAKEALKKGLGKRLGVENVF